MRSNEIGRYRKRYSLEKDLALVGLIHRKWAMKKREGMKETGVLFPDILQNRANWAFKKSRIFSCSCSYLKKATELRNTIEVI